MRSSGRAVRVHSDDGARLVNIGLDPFRRIHLKWNLCLVLSSRKIKLLPKLDSFFQDRLSPRV